MRILVAGTAAAMQHRLFIPFIITLAFLVHTTRADILVMIRGSNQIIEEFNDEPARFGASFPINGLRALPVMSNPSNACQPIEPPPNTNSTKVPRFVVIISRGNCSFEDKVRHAQKAGYSAAIVHNVGSNDLEPMSANNGDDIDIPSMFVGESTGKIIIYNYLWKEGFALILNGDSPFNINTHLLVPFCAVVGLCFVIMVGLMITKCIREQRRQRRHRLPGSVLKKIPIIRFSSKEPDCSRFETCAICIEDYIDGDRLRVLPCAHAYHHKCIDPWLTKNRRVCPICKRKVFVRGEPRRRRRRSTDDSMSDTDNDDTTPLINPANQSAANSHGTFQPTAPPPEEADAEALHAQHQRFNPFDRQANAMLPSAEVIQDSVSFWTRVRRLLHLETDAADQPANQDVEQQMNHEQEIMQTQSNVAQPIPSFSSDSIVGNQSMSGSLRHFRRTQPASINESRSSDDEEADETNDSFHECNEPQQNIYSPISTSQPSINSIDQQERQQPQYFFARDEIAGPSNQRIAVAALPNLDFEHGATIGGRPISTSSPSIYSQQPNNDSGSSNGSNNEQRRSFLRNATASSRNYFV